MSKYKPKRAKESGNETDIATVLNLITAILELMATLIVLWEHFS